MKNIFISSTFVDMQAERDMVQERVIPMLREEARKYGENVSAIDLRWGVDTSTLETEEGAAKVLKVCLDEIDRSHPYMLIFLGDRYGTVVGEEQIKRSIWGREDKYTTNDFVKSITALEIEYGALSERYGELEHCIVCFREPVIHMLSEPEQKLYEEQSEYGKQKLNALKERIKHDLGEKGYFISYSCKWDASVCKLVDFEVNGQPLEEILIKCYIEMFQKDWKAYQDISWQEKEQLSFDALMEHKLRSFVGREGFLEECYQSIKKANKPFLLQGEAGSGKTAVMCKLIERMRKDGKNVFAFFSGNSNMSNTAEKLVKQMVYYMENLLGMEIHFTDKMCNEQLTKESELVVGARMLESYQIWKSRLEELCAALPKGEKVYFFIDALEQLRKESCVKKLDFFLNGRNVQMIASCSNDFILPVRALVDREIKKMPALEEADALTVIEGILSSSSRNTYATIAQEILKKKSASNPFYISLVIQRLNMMDADELRKAMNEEEIIALGVKVVRELPDEAEDAMVAILQNALQKIAKEGQDLTEVVQYLAVSRNGISMQDLIGIFRLLDKKLPVLDVTLLLKYLNEFFNIHEDGRIDFAYQSIRKGILKKIENQKILEEIVKEYLKTLHECEELRKYDGIYLARRCEDIEFAKELMSQATKEWNFDIKMAIRDDIVETGGAFYCSLIDGETEENSAVCDFFFGTGFWDRFSKEKEETDAKVAIIQSLVHCKERLYESYHKEEILRDLCVSYSILGSVWIDLGKLKKALEYYKIYLDYAQKLYELFSNDGNYGMLLSACHANGYTLLELKQAKDAVPYFQKAMEGRRELHEKFNCEDSLRDLSSACEWLANALRDSGRVWESLDYYVKALKGFKELNEKFETKQSLARLASGYVHMGKALLMLRKTKKALFFCEKSVEHAEKSYKMPGHDVGLDTLLYSYNVMAIVLRADRQLMKAISYIQKVVDGKEELHRRYKNETSLNDLAISYSNLGVILDESGYKEDALPFLKVSLRYKEELYTSGENGVDEKDLINLCREIIEVLNDLDEQKETIQFYEKMIYFMEKVYEQTQSEKDLWKLSLNYKRIGHVLGDLGQLGEAVLYYDKFLVGRKDRLKDVISYYEKDVECSKELYEKYGGEELFQELLISMEKLQYVQSYFGLL